MGDELRYVDWPFRDIYSLAALYQGIVEKIGLEQSETTLHCIHNMDYYRAIGRGMCYCS